MIMQRLKQIPNFQETKAKGQWNDTVKTAARMEASVEVKKSIFERFSDVCDKCNYTRDARGNCKCEYRDGSQE